MCEGLGGRLHHGLLAAAGLCAVQAHVTSESSSKSWAVGGQKKRSNGGRRTSHNGKPLGPAAKAALIHRKPPCGSDLGWRYAPAGPPKLPIAETVGSVNSEYFRATVRSVDALRIPRLDGLTAVRGNPPFGQRAVSGGMISAAPLTDASHPHEQWLREYGQTFTCVLPANPEKFQDCRSRRAQVRLQMHHSRFERGQDQPKDKIRAQAERPD